MVWTVFAALAPAVAVGVFQFGWPALRVLAVAVGASAALAAVAARGGGRRAAAGEGALVGLLLGASLPPAVPAWVVAAGSAIAWAAGRVAIPGRGGSPFHPVLVARAALLLAIPGPLTTWTAPAGLFAGAVDAVSGATPLAAVAMPHAGAPWPAADARWLLERLAGRSAGCVGETSAFALLLGGAFLIARGAVGWEVPAALLAGVAGPAAALHAVFPERFAGAGLHVFSGGLLLCALFLAADPARAPRGRRGRLWFGAGCGALTWLLRSFGAYPEGVGFAVLLMSTLTPLIDDARGSGARTADG